MAACVLLPPQGSPIRRPEGHLFRPELIPQVDDFFFKSARHDIITSAVAINPSPPLFSLAKKKE